MPYESLHVSKFQPMQFTTDIIYKCGYLNSFISIIIFFAHLLLRAVALYTLKIFIPENSFQLQSF